jgi:protein-S-isoprenylcysteine O-methyltransferase Ste14
VNRPLLRAILILPVNVMIVVPALILWLTASGPYAGTLAGVATPHFWIAFLLILLGLVLGNATTRLFVRRGEGTPAPWDPPRRLVVRGVYRHVRNPMISGVIAVLLGEALLFQSLPLLGWAALFAAVNLIYIPFWEEPGLERRFGEDYRLYRRSVPRWIPRLRPWRGLDRAA